MLQDLPGPVEMGMNSAGEPQCFRGTGWTALVSTFISAGVREDDIVEDQQEESSVA